MQKMPLPEPREMGDVDNSEASQEAQAVGERCCSCFMNFYYGVLQIKSLLQPILPETDGWLR